MIANEIDVLLSEAHLISMIDSKRRLAENNKLLNAL
jgi:hypothetical protein